MPKKVAQTFADIGTAVALFQGLLKVQCVYVVVQTAYCSELGLALVTLVRLAVVQTN